jgi:DNA-binding NarL/FixJ family response regulator
VAAGHAERVPAVQRRLLEALGGGVRFAVAGPAPGSGGGREASVHGPAGLPGLGAQPASPHAAAARYVRLPDELTPREAEVLGHIAAGLSNAEIAATLFVSEATVKTHINHIFTKTGLRDRAQLVGYAFRHRLASPG